LAVGGALKGDIVKENKNLLNNIIGGNE